MNSDIFSQALAGKRGKHQQLIAEAVAREWGELLLRKNHDYGSAIFSPPVLAPDIPASLAIQVRLSDKLSRIKNLLDSPAEVSEESIDDSMLDYAAYRLLQRIAERLESPKLADMAGMRDGDPPTVGGVADSSREFAYIDGVTYEIPDGRDIGKEAWVSSSSPEDACHYRVVVRIADYRPQHERPYVTEGGFAWKHAVLVPETRRQTVNVDGDTYAIPDGRDIGKAAWVSGVSPEYAVSSRLLCIIDNYRPESEYPFGDDSGGIWKYAVLVPEGSSNE